MSVCLIFIRHTDIEFHSMSRGTMRTLLSAWWNFLHPTFFPTAVGCIMPIF